MKDTKEPHQRITDNNFTKNQSSYHLTEEQWFAETMTGREFC